MVKRLRSSVSLWGLAVILLIAAAVAISMFRARPMGLSIGVHSYDRQAARRSAFLVLTNAGATALTVPLRFECQVELTSGSTNYIFDTRYTVFLKPREHVVLSRTNYAIPLPDDTSTWKVKVQIRQQTRRERFVNALIRCGIKNSAFLSMFSGPPRKDEEFQWQESQSSSFGASLAPSSGNSE